MVEGLVLKNLKFEVRVIADLESGHFEIGDFVEKVIIEP
jgi:hypothetical protein